ncbi:SWI/SNF-related matrix-associated actin-dependent regulator of chromatin subfamily E member 1 isoform X3 [Culicoides brevitarsis]|uniref:SWI/SNF-related matrix-associated actin-dependent regulator of chromatin subfamily E member 1 isoform X3 n=1 Tax=Culicoides brevitarsis TaxID=469753 RepID=UPI00307B90EA
MMALPPNYKQIAMQSPGPSHMMSPGMSNPLSFNILKERLRASGGGGDRKDTASPFSHSIHGNPAFTPQKVGKSSVSLETRAPKPPKAPEKPLMPYWRYSRKVWDQVKADNPEMKLWEVSKLIGQQWRDLSDEEKQEYINEYEVDKAQYIDALKTYQMSPEFVVWRRHQTKYRDSDMHHEPQRKQADRRIDIQPAEDDDDPDQDGFSVKHVAYARYLRNHRLINEIFSDAVVPDVRSVVTTQRMHVLKRQVQSLAMHQMKLQAELQQIEEKFESKKRKFVESSDVFQEELKRHCKPAVDDEKFKQMVERQYEILKRERMRAMEQQQQQTAQVNQPPAPGPESVGATEATPASENAPPTGSVTEMKTPDKAEEPETIGSDPQQPAATSAPVSETEKPEEASSEPMEVEPPAKQTEEVQKPSESETETTVLQPAAPAATQETAPPVVPEAPKAPAETPVAEKEAPKAATEQKPSTPATKEPAAAKVMPPPQIPQQQQQAPVTPGNPPVMPPQNQQGPPHMPPYHQGYGPQGYAPSAYGPGPYQHYPQHYPQHPPYGYHNQFPQGPGYAPTPYHYAPQQTPPAGPPPTAMTPEHAPPTIPPAIPPPAQAPVAENAPPPAAAAVPVSEPEKKSE